VSNEQDFSRLSFFPYLEQLRRYFRDCRTRTEAFAQTQRNRNVKELKVKLSAFARWLSHDNTTRLVRVRFAPLLDTMQSEGGSDATANGLYHLNCESIICRLVACLPRYSAGVGLLSCSWQGQDVDMCALEQQLPVAIETLELMRTGFGLHFLQLVAFAQKCQDAGQPLRVESGRNQVWLERNVKQWLRSICDLLKMYFPNMPLMPALYRALWRVERRKGPYCRCRRCARWLGAYEVLAARTRGRHSVRRGGCWHCFDSLQGRKATLTVCRCHRPHNVHLAQRYPGLIGFRFAELVLLVKSCSVSSIDLVRCCTCVVSRRLCWARSSNGSSSSLSESVFYKHFHLTINHKNKQHVSINMYTQQRINKDRLAASRNSLSYDVLNQLMMVVANGQSLQDFDFDEATRVFIGWKKRRSVSVKHLQTPTSRGSARAVIAYSWTKDSAIEPSRQL
jgi:hypothetical protein